MSAGDVLKTFWACIIAVQSLDQVLSRIILLEKGKLAGASLRKILGDRLRGARTNETRGAFYPFVCGGQVEVCNVSYNPLESAALFFFFFFFQSHIYFE